MGLVSNILWSIRRRRMIKAFENDDVETIAKMGPHVSSPAVAEAGFHKARAACESVSMTKRRESLYWLYERGMKSLSARTEGEG